MISFLTCQELVELVTDYLEGKLSPADHSRFEQHLSGCTACRNYLSQMRQTIKLVGQLSPDNIPVAEQDELLQLFRNWKSNPLN
jgi:predicted anti-sigma-YlaC factor YlaD